MKPAGLLWAQRRSNLLIDGYPVERLLPATAFGLAAKGSLARNDGSTLDDH
jgi:hypothetical protein